MRAIAQLGLCLLAFINSSGYAQDRSERSAAELMDVVMWNREPIGGHFRLTDHTGKIRSDKDFLGQIMLVYFGYTFCPDVCPTDLQQIGQAMTLLGESSNGVTPIFITLDPDRDTRELLSHYVPSFHPKIVGLTGKTNDIQALARAYKVYYAKVPVSGWARYTIDHSSYIYIMDRKGKYLGFFPPGTSAHRIASYLTPHLQGSR